MWDKKNVYRTTKCFSSKIDNDYPGGFPFNFLKWVNDMGWRGQRRCYLCSGAVKDDTAVRVDLNPSVNPDYLEDASNTTIESESFDWIMIDPPYTKDLATSLYGMGKHYHSINAFAKEAERLCMPGGLILTLSYEVPKRIKNCNVIVCCGIYQTLSVAHMRCFTVWKKINPLVNHKLDV